MKNLMAIILLLTMPQAFGAWGVSEKSVKGWELLIEGLLIQKCKSLPVSQAITHSSFFPFDLCCRVNTLRHSPRFEVHRQGLDIDLMGLKATKDLV